MREATFFGIDGILDRMAFDVGEGSRIASKADIVIDLETLGRAPGCQVLELGAAVLRPDGHVRYFQAFPNLDEQAKQGLTTDPQTVLWWMGADLAEARQAQLSGHGSEGQYSMPVRQALHTFAAFIDEQAADREACVWGNGASFDLGILGALYDAFGIARPWPFWSERDLRTVFDLKGKRIMSRAQGSQHIGRLDAAHELAQLHYALTPEV